MCMGGSMPSAATAAAAAGLLSLCELAKEISHIQVLVILLFSNCIQRTQSPQKGRRLTSNSKPLGRIIGLYNQQTGTYFICIFPWGLSWTSAKLRKYVRANHFSESSRHV